MSSTAAPDALTTYTVRNLAEGPRGFHVGAEPIMIPAGTSLLVEGVSAGDRKVAERSGNFEFVEGDAQGDRKGVDDGAPPLLQPKEVEQLSNEQLKDYLTVHKRSVADNAKRPEMLVEAKKIV